MDCIKFLNSFEEVKSLISEIQNRRSYFKGFQEYYRGHVSNGFSLIPSISRNSRSIEILSKIEQEIFKEFKSEINSQKLQELFLLQPLTVGEFKDDWYLLSQAQHLGLPTRLMDWTLKWEIALFFAVEDSDKYNDNDGQFWVFSPPFSMILNDTRKGEFLNLHPFQFKNQNLINPAFFWTENYEKEIAEIRRARQHGKFFIQSLSASSIPMENQPYLSQLLEKYCIPKEAKLKIRNELEDRGFIKKFLYPDLNEEIKGVIKELKEKYSLI